MGHNNITQPSQTSADIVSHKTQEQLHVTFVVQKPPINEIGKKRIITLPVETFGKSDPHFHREHRMHLME